MALAKTTEDSQKELEALLTGPIEQDMWRYTHVFTHRIWHMTAYRMDHWIVPEGEYQWFTPEEYKQIPLAGPHAKLAAFVEGQM